MRRIRGKVIAVCTVIAIILAAREALTAEIPVVYAENGSDIDDAAVLEEDGEDEQDTENSASGDGENEDKDGDEKDGDTDKASGGVNSGTGSADGSRKDGDTDKAGGNVNSGKDSASDSQTDGGNKTDGKPDADTDDAEADSDADVKTEDDTLADAEEEPEETLPPAEIRSVFSLRSSRSTGTNVSSEEELSNALWSGESVINLASDIALRGLFELGDELTLNLKGNTLSCETNVFDVYSDLTINGPGTISCREGSAIIVGEGGKVTISDATVNGMDCGIESYGGIVTINSGEITGSRAACYISGGESVSRTLTINGGTFKATSGQSLYYAASKSAEINGGTFANGVGVELRGSEVDINSLPIGEWATRFNNIIIGSFDKNTFKAEAIDGSYYYYIASSTNGQSQEWDGSCTEIRSLSAGNDYSFGAGKWTVGGDDAVYSAGSFCVPSSGTYTFTKKQ